LLGGAKAGGTAARRSAVRRPMALQPGVDNVVAGGAATRRLTTRRSGSCYFFRGVHANLVPVNL
jgi:hypothetical protein